MHDFQELYAIMFLNLMSAMEYGKITHMNFLVTWFGGPYTVLGDSEVSHCLKICFGGGP